MFSDYAQELGVGAAVFHHLVAADDQRETLAEVHTYAKAWAFRKSS